MGLLDRLPKPGDVWPEAELQLLEGSFKLIYKDKTEVAKGGDARDHAHAGGDSLRMRAPGLHQMCRERSAI